MRRSHEGAENSCINSSHYRQAEFAPSSVRANAMSILAIYGEHAWICRSTTVVQQTFVQRPFSATLLSVPLVRIRRVVYFVTLGEALMSCLLSVYR